MRKFTKQSRSQTIPKGNIDNTASLINFLTVNLTLFPNKSFRHNHLNRKRTFMKM